MYASWGGVGGGWGGGGKQNYLGQEAGIEDVLEAGKVGLILRACGFAAFVHQVTQEHHHIRLCVAVCQRKCLPQEPEQQKAL